MSKKHRRHRQQPPEPRTVQQAIQQSQQAGASAVPSSGSGGRCNLCGGKVQGEGSPTPGIPWTESAPWPRGSFRARCRQCGGHVIVLPNGEAHSLEGLDQWRNAPPEALEIVRARIKQREGLPTFVCVGTSPDSAGLTPWDEPGIIGFAALNDCHVLPFIHMDKITQWYQLHHRWRFTRRNPRHGENDHWGWLQQKHDFPIYMQKQYDDVPSSVAFPLREYSEKYLACRLGRGGGFQRQYFTSTFPYVLMHIMDTFEKQYMPSDYNPLHDGPYARIEFYGVELAQKQEYIEQRPNMEFWSGYCTGRGVQLYVPENCRIFDGQVYGYRVPDRAGAMLAVRQSHPQGPQMSSAQVAALALGENLLDDDNIGVWEPYPDNKYALEYPEMTEDDWAIPGLEVMSETTQLAEQSEMLAR